MQTLSALIKLSRKGGNGVPARSGGEESPPWLSAGRRYDVRRMSRDELCSMARDLYASGAIGFPDMRVLTLHPDTQAENWPGWTCFETPGQHGGQRDWIYEIETRLAKGHEDPAYISYQQRMFHFLKRVQSAREILLGTQHIPETAPVAAKRRYGFARGQTLPFFGRRARSLAT